MKRMTMALAAIAALAVFSQDGSEASIPNEVPLSGSAYKCTTPDITFTFTDARRCASGSKVGALCQTDAQCGAGPKCAAPPAVPASASFSVMDLNGRTPVTLVASTALPTGQSTVTTTLPIAATKVSGSSNTKYRITAQWTISCAGGSAVGQACTQDTDCPGSICRRGVGQADLTIYNVPGASC